jgi:two-component system, NtrC family, response regulator HydG
MSVRSSRLWIASTTADPFPEIHGHSPTVRRLKEHMLRVARDPDISVLIVGESGTGKERVARAIHRASPRHSRSFVVVNCAGLAPSLVEDELFGHARGAFTGAVADRAGPFERAAGGTVFLDEVGDLAPDLQMKLLRALQERTVQRLGGKHETSFDVRVIAATNVDLEAAVQRGVFRLDLYYRLKVYPLRVPSLRERGPDDVADLADAFLAAFARRRQRGARRFAPEVLELFGRCAWRGNVRELENTIECMVVAAGADEELTLEHLPDGFQGGAAVHLQPPGRSRALPERDDIAKALEHNGFHCDRTSRELGLSRHQLYRLIKRYGLRETTPRP